MSKIKISTQEFVNVFQEIISLPWWRVIHPSAGWLFIDMGKSYQDYVSGENGEEKLYVRGIYQINVKGNWYIEKNEKIVNSRNVGKNETQKEYFDRMESIVNNFPIKFVISIKFENEKLVFEANDDYKICVSLPKDADSLSFTKVELDKNNKPINYTHWRYSEDLKSLAKIESEQITIQ